MRRALEAVLREYTERLQGAELLGRHVELEDCEATIAEILDDQPRVRANIIVTDRPGGGGPVLPPAMPPSAATVMQLQSRQGRAAIQ